MIHDFGFQPLVFWNQFDPSVGSLRQKSPCGYTTASNIIRPPRLTSNHTCTSPLTCLILKQVRIDASEIWWFYPPLSPWWTTSHHVYIQQVVFLVARFPDWWLSIISIPVVPGQAGGGSFQKEKNYIAQKEFAYRMCARRPTSAMPKSFLCCEQAFCRSMVVMFCALKWSVLMSWCLLRGQVMWWSRHLMRCDGLFCVMSRDAMRCHGDELYYSSTTLYYKVLLQYYPVLQSTTPVLLCTTNYYSNTTPYYKYYSVLQSTTPILLRTTNTTLYYKVLLQYYFVVQVSTGVVLCSTG